MQEYKNITVIGMGKSGLSAVRLLKLLDKNIWAINQGSVEQWGSHEILKDLNQSHLVAQDDPKAIEVVNQSDLIILSPGIPRDIDLLKNCQAPIWCEIELAWQYCDAPVMGLTGTNGKTTTVSFLEECFKHEGKPYFVGGNIGTPFCDYIYQRKTGEIDQAWGIILELSSFQLESIQDFKPKIASILNITFSHGERYNLLSDYANAKREIFKNMDESDFSFWPVGLWDELGLKAPEHQSFEEIHFDKIETVKSYLENLFDLTGLKIYGEHNLKNIYMAFKMWDKFGGSKEAFQQAINSFSAVEYRLQFLGEIEGVKVFNDAKSTNWEATETAIRGVRDLGPITLILGGQRRGEGDDRFDILEKYKSHIQKVLLIGEAGEFLYPLMKDQFPCEYVETIQGVKDYSAKELREGVLLFSPAFPSFDQFRNYIERGKSFTELFID